MARVVIVGAGKLGVRHLQVYDRLPGTTVVGLAEPSDAAYSDACAAVGSEPVRYRSVAAAVADPDVDVVDVCTPTPLHREHVCAGLEAGKAVFCEKPLAPGGRDFAAVEAALRPDASTVRVGYLYRFHDRMQKLKRRLDDDVLGTPRLAVFRIGGRGSHQIWKHRRESGGGALLDMAAHMIDLAYWLFGPIDEIQPLHQAVLMPKREIDGEIVEVDADDLVMVRLVSRTGVEVLIHADFLSPGFAHSVEVSGDRGTAHVSVITGVPDRYVLVGAAADLQAGDTFEPGEPSPMLERELEAFVADLEDGRTVQDLEGSRLVARVVDAAAAEGDRTDG